MKVLWYNPETQKTEEYRVSKHAHLAHKFLFWGTPERGTLLVGPRATEFHRSLYASAKHNGDFPQKTPHAAGDCNNGEITGWVSTGYRVWTDDILREPIEEALGMKACRNPKESFVD